MAAIVRAQEGNSPFGTQAIPAVVPAAAPPVAATVAPQVNAKDQHTKLVEMFEAAEDASRDNREKAERDRDYFDGKQWTSEEVKKLAKRGQPAIAKNRIKRKIRYLQGLEQQKRTKPRALPRTPKHDFDAQDITDALRFVTESNRYDRIRSDAYKDLCIAGWGGVSIRIEVKPNAANPRVVLEASKWDRMFYDPFSQNVDFSDANYLGEVIWMDRETAVLQYGEAAAKVFDETVASARVGGTYADKPKDHTWVSYEKRWRVRVVKMYYIGADGIWQFCEFSKGGYMKSGPSPYLDDDGNPEHEYAWRSYEVDRDNQRYGEVRGMIDTQDEVNKRASKLLHLVSVRQTFSNNRADGNQTPEDRRRELAKPDGHLDMGAGEFGKDFGVIPTTDLAQGQMELLKINLAESDLEGPNAAMLGQGPKSASGRAILANQSGGALEGNPTFDTLQDMDHEVYRKVWRRVRQFWKAEEWVRVTDDERNIRWVGLNTPRTQPVAHPMTGQPLVDPSTGQPAMQPVVDPNTGQPVLTNELASLEIDIIIDDAPSVGTMQQEEFAELAQLGNTPIGQLPVYPKLLIKASNFRHKAEMLEDLKKHEEQGPPPDPKIQALQAQGQLEMQKMQLQNQQAVNELEVKKQLGAGELEIELKKLAATVQVEREKAAIKHESDKKAMLLKTLPEAPEDVVRGIVDELIGGRQDNTDIHAKLDGIAQHLSAPAEIIRGPDGRPVGVRKGGVTQQIVRGPDGRVQALA